MTPAPDKEAFDLVGLCLAPQTDYVLWECKCGACKTTFSGAYWNGNWAQELTQKVFDQRLLQRYQTALEMAAALKGEDLNINGRLTTFMGSSERD